MKRTGPGRGCTVRQGAILLARELEKRDGCLSVCLCVGVFRITEKRATCADRELHRCRFLLAGVCVSQSGRSARETAPADRHVHTHKLKKTEWIFIIQESESQRIIYKPYRNRLNSTHLYILAEWYIHIHVTDTLLFEWFFPSFSTTLCGRDLIKGESDACRQ